MTPFLRNRCSNRMGNALGEAVEEILDDNGVNLVSKQDILPALVDPRPGDEPCPDADYTPARLDRLQSILETEYGSRGGRGLSVRIGRASFKYLLGAFGSEYGLMEPSFRLLPLKVKMKKGSEVLAGLFNAYTDLNIRQEQDEQYLYWHVERQPHLAENEGPRCCLPMGMLQEARYWVRAGKVFEVEEKDRASDGSPARMLRVHRSPIG